MVQRPRPWKPEGTEVGFRGGWPHPSLSTGSMTAPALVPTRTGRQTGELWMPAQVDRAGSSCGCRRDVKTPPTCSRTGVTEVLGLGQSERVEVSFATQTLRFLSQTPERGAQVARDPAAPQAVALGFLSGAGGTRFRGPTENSPLPASASRGRGVRRAHLEPQVVNARSWRPVPASLPVWPQQGPASCRFLLSCPHGPGPSIPGSGTGLQSLRPSRACPGSRA